MTGRSSSFTVRAADISWTPSAVTRRRPFASSTADCVVPEAYTTYFRSVIVFGTVRILTAEREKYEAIDKLALKYAPDAAAEHRRNAIDREWKSLCLAELTRRIYRGKPPLSF